MIFGFPGVASGEEPTCQHRRLKRCTFHASLEEDTATHPSILAWRIPWTEEPEGLQSRALQRAGHDKATQHIRTHVVFSHVHIMQF